MLRTSFIKGIAALGAALALLTLTASPSAHAADPLPAPAPRTAEQDHQDMMDQLHITTLRPGADGFNAQAPNAQNTDESKATRYTNLPDPLVLKNGRNETHKHRGFAFRDITLGVCRCC